MKLGVMSTIQSEQIHLFLAPVKEGGLVRYLTHVSENWGSFLNLMISFNICFNISLWDVETPVLPDKLEDRHTCC